VCGVIELAVFEVLTEVAMENTVFWVLIPHILEKALHFGGTYYLHLRVEE
jgi:hypothetical protein